jgi:hypothetical protein
VPSPQSKRIVSPSRCTDSAATLRSTVGQAAPVPRKVTLSTQNSFTVTGTFPGCFCSSSSSRFMLWLSSRMSV